MVIFTRNDGTPFERPTPPPKDCSLAESLAYMRAVHAFNDAITDEANKAFAQAFKQEVNDEA